MNTLITLAALAALLVLFVAGLRVPVGRGRMRTVARLLSWLAALAAVALVNAIAYRNDVHLDVTREQAFTPSDETLRIVRGLSQDVDLVYFYQAQNPAGRAAKQMVEVLGKENPRLRVRTIDPDQQPALASQMGVRIYNAALLMAGGERVEVITTDDREIGLGILRLLRRDLRPLCFLTGHGEYDIENFEFHTHFEGSQSHNHETGGIAVVNMEQHGMGRLRRALDKLGYQVRRINLATSTELPKNCAAIVDPNPRTAHAPHEVALLASYLQSGGNLLFLLEPDFSLAPELAALLRRAGVAVGNGVVVDPTSHYYTDSQMVAVEKYGAHPATIGLALSFFPGARPLQAVAVQGVKTTVLAASSAESTILARSTDLAPTNSSTNSLTNATTSASTGSTSGSSAAPAPRALAIAAEGLLDGQGRPFKLAVVGDADFASNSFYPYLANADFVLGLAAWLRGEPRGPAMKPPVEVLPTVAMTNSQMQLIFIGCVIVLPGLCALIGVLVWWRRRY